MLHEGSKRGGEVLADALLTFERLGARGDAARARAQLKAHGVTLPYPLRGGRRRYGPELSPRELEVADLAGMGHTNKEIAKALFISPHTAAAHVSSALRKLGAASRNDLQAALHEYGRER